MRVLILAALVAFAAATIPTSFDARQKWKSCAWKILDQGRCGSCWDFSSMESFGDRACISGEAPSGTIMSPEPILQCSKDACGGGNPNVAWNWVIANGDTTCTNNCNGGCAPYDSYSCRNDGSCSTCNLHKCDSGAKWTVEYQASKFNSLARGAISTFQQHLMDNGPLQACFTEYHNFQPFFNDHPDGIYTSTDGSDPAGGHCVKMIGWGVSGTTDYWIFANSWASSWGDNGYFKMLRGKNLCGIENQVSEGFTAKQGAILEATGYDFQADTNATYEEIFGGWLHQENANSPTWVSAAKEGLSLLQQKTGVTFVLKEMLDAQTQVVNGLNYNLLVSTEAGNVRLHLHRSPQMVWELEDYEILH